MARAGAARLRGPAGAGWRVRGRRRGPRARAGLTTGRRAPAGRRGPGPRRAPCVVPPARVGAAGGRTRGARRGNFPGGPGPRTRTGAPPRARAPQLQCPRVPPPPRSYASASASSERGGAGPGRGRAPGREVILGRVRCARRPTPGHPRPREPSPPPWGPCGPRAATPPRASETRWRFRGLSARETAQGAPGPSSGSPTPRAPPRPHVPPQPRGPPPSLNQDPKRRPVPSEGSAGNSGAPQARMTRPRAPRPPEGLGWGRPSRLR